MRSVGLGEIVELPLPGLGGPSAFRFVGHHLLWLAGEPGTLVQALWALDLRGGEPLRAAAGPGGDEGSLSHEERLRRERLRERALGITRFSVAAGRLLVPIGGEWWVGTAPRADDLRKRLDAPALDARLSPDGRRIAFVRDDELYVADVDGRGERQLTSGARGSGRVHGRPEYIAQEEMHRLEGFWWSPDSQFLAYTAVDETVVPIWRIPYNGDPQPRWEDHRYPFAGARNAAVALYVVAAGGGTPVQMDLGPPEHAEYLARVAFFPDGDLAVQVQDRRQRRLELRRLDPATGRGRTLLVDAQDTFVELHDLFHPLASGGYLWGSEASGFLHLERVGADGVRSPLTSGPWVVDALCGVDERRGLVWFLSSKDSPRERHLYCVPLAGGEIRRVTQRRGWHSVVVDVEHDRFVCTRSSIEDPPATWLCALADGTETRLVHAPADPRVDGLAPAVPFTVPGRSGDELHGLFYRPSGEGPFPTVVFVYGGPHAQRVQNAWDTTIDLRAQHLRGLGVAVMRLDNRGSGRRGHAFVRALYGETGRVELEDQADAVRALIARGWVDEARVGITGWSYGGYLTLKAMFGVPELFKVGVAGAPVTHWDAYDTHYTERYMGLPQENADGYDRSSALHADGLRGALMVVHGMLDENVHFRHTGRLINALVAAGKEFRLQVFPDERHMPRKPADRLYMERQIVEFLVRHLMVGDTPVSDPPRGRST